MKVTIEGTEPHNTFPSPTVTISYPGDDVDAEDALDMVKKALVAWGYQWNNIFEDNVRLSDNKNTKRSNLKCRE